MRQVVTFGVTMSHTDDSEKLLPSTFRPSRFSPVASCDGRAEEKEEEEEEQSENAHARVRAPVCFAVKLMRQLTTL